MKLIISILDLTVVCLAYFFVFYTITKISKKRILMIILLVLFTLVNLLWLLDEDMMYYPLGSLICISTGILYASFSKSEWVMERHMKISSMFVILFFCSICGFYWRFFWHSMPMFMAAAVCYAAPTALVLWLFENPFFRAVYIFFFCCFINSHPFFPLLLMGQSPSSQFPYLANYHPLTYIILATTTLSGFFMREKGENHYWRIFLAIFVFSFFTIYGWSYAHTWVSWVFKPYYLEHSVMTSISIIWLMSRKGLIDTIQ